MCVITDVFWGRKPFHVMHQNSAPKPRSRKFKFMPAQISEEVKKAWPKKGDRVRCLFGTDKHDGVVQSCSRAKGTCKVKFDDSTDTVNLKHPKWGVILERKKKVRG